MINILRKIPIIGIYKITSPTNRIYIGQSKNILDRWKYHYFNINGCKEQSKLYNSFIKYGVINHKFEIIEECLIERLNEQERYWQDYYNVLKGGLNCRLTKSSDRSGRFIELEKIILQYDLEGNFIREWSSIKEASLYLNIDKSGISECCRGNQNKSNNFVWKFYIDNYPMKIDEYKLIRIFSDDHKKLISKNSIGKKGRKINQFDLNGNFLKEWNNISEAKEIYNGDIQGCCAGKYKSSKGFIWRYV